MLLFLTCGSSLSSKKIGPDDFDKQVWWKSSEGGDVVAILFGDEADLFAVPTRDGEIGRR